MRADLLVASVIADLDSKIASEDQGWTRHHKDVFQAIRDCLTGSVPISRELQEQYVLAIANNQAVDKYGK